MVSPLDMKMFRDLRRIKGQAIAIALVIGLGVLLLVMMDGLVNTLEESKRAYYERFRLADMFAPVQRAPERTSEKLKAIPGITAVEGRVVGSALIDLRDVDVPIRARALSLPDFREARLNHIYITDGRSFDPDHPDEIILLKSFAEARNLSPGDALTVTLRGNQKELTIVGLARSPEFVYTTPPGELVPDDKSFAVIWMSKTAMSAAYDMEGAYNEFLLSLGPGTRVQPVLDRADRILNSYGGSGAYGLEDLVSNRFLTEEISGLKASTLTVPPVFLAVAAFLLYIVISRMVQVERQQIGLLKAFGYTSLEVSLHYLKLVLTIAIAGAAVGSLLGVLSGHEMAKLYQQYYKLPFLVFSVDPGAFVVGFLVSTVTASAGGLLVLRSIFSLTPAVAMRPPAPADYSRTGRFSGWLARFLDQPSRMVLRRIFRQPWKTIGAVAGIATGMALSAGIISVMSGFSQAIDISFNEIDRSDASVTFIHPLSTQSILELQRVRGVQHVEPFRAVAVVFRHGRREHRGSISGMVERPVLYRALDDQRRPVELDKNGIVLSRPVADILQAGPGDVVTVEVREGRRPVLQIPVTGVTETLLGSPTFMSIESLNHTMGEPHRVSGAYLTFDKDRSATLYREIKNMPSVAGIALTENSSEALQKVMDEGAGATRYVMAFIAALITFGIVYNAARIAYAERERDLASLRVIGFTRGETAFVLLGELGFVTLVSLPIGSALGYLFSVVIARGFSTDLYQIPAYYSPESIGFAGLAVVCATLVSGWFVKRDIDSLEMVSALKSRE